MSRLNVWLVQFWRSNRALLIFLPLMFGFRSAIADWMVVPSGSMNPTLMEGDRIWVHKLEFGLRVPFTLIRLTDGELPQRGDIVVFESPANGKTLVKRLIGLPGDRIAMRDEQLYINGVKASYAPLGDDTAPGMVAEFTAVPHQLEREQLGQLDHAVMFLPERGALRSFAPVDVPAGQYLMLGDNRDDSADSRFIGLVPRRLLLGRATCVVVSLNPEHYYLPRTQRTLAQLH
ncbi:MAG: signal peptidase [Nevskia sp.]|nr:signal peptidase [Nevskia sp.]